MLLLSFILTVIVVFSQYLYMTCTLEEDIPLKPFVKYILVLFCVITGVLYAASNNKSYKTAAIKTGLPPF